MRLTVLTDNNSIIDSYFLAEPALSFFIESEGKRILFDTGYSDVFLKNAEKFGLNLLDIDFLVLSHGHQDHVRGLSYLFDKMADKANKAIENNKPVLLAHPALFDQRHDKKGVNIGGPLSIDQIKDYFEICLTDQPRWLTKNLVFLGEIPRLTPFESKMPLGYRISDKEKIPDMLQDDTGLAFISDEGLVIISGCAHSGICNTIIHAENVTGITRLAEVVGGLHLMNAPEKLVQGTMQFLTEQNPKNMHPCHCTDLASKIELAAELPIHEMGTGMQLIY